MASMTVQPLSLLSVVAAIGIVCLLPATGLSAAPYEAGSGADQMSFRFRDNFTASDASHHDLRMIYAEGPIVPGTALKFQVLIDRFHVRPGASVEFDSLGGNVQEAMRLGEAIRAAGLNTEVPRSPESRSHSLHGCVSACTLSFLGGVNRNVASGARFGVHMLSAELAGVSPQTAMQLGQKSIADLSSYVSRMGVKSEFVSELTRARPEQVNVLSAEMLRRLNVTTAAFTTTWEIKSLQGRFYLSGSTQRSGGVDKMTLSCAPKPTMAFQYAASGDLVQKALREKTDYRLQFDDRKMTIPNSDIMHPVAPTADGYLGVRLKLSPAILENLRHTTSLTFQMMVPSHDLHWGWTMDFASGREGFFDFLKSCH
jgi:hypothetical protein